jgi:hypothetical protein
MGFERRGRCARIVVVSTSIVGVEWRRIIFWFLLDLHLTSASSRLASPSKEVIVLFLLQRRLASAREVVLEGVIG